jgi:hypothetical protein
MPIPSLITDLSTTVGSNSPAGSDNVFPDLDNYLRALSAFLASIRDNSGNGWVSPYATVASPTLTGTPAAPTAAIGTNSTQVATTAYADRAAFTGATWQNLTGSRAKTTVYTNSSGRAIAVTIIATGAAAGDCFSLLTGSVSGGFSTQARIVGGDCFMNSIIVAPSGTYQMNDRIGTTTVVAWYELRT